MNQRFNVDDILIMHSPYSNDDCEVNFRGNIGDGKAMVWSGKTQFAVPLEWLRKKTT